MNAQLQFPLLTSTPIARRTDPDSSHEGARTVTQSGKRAEQQAAVLAFLRKCPCQTASELADIAAKNGRADLDRYVFGRRLPELAKTEDDAGRRIEPLAKKAGKRKCRITGLTVTTWRPA